MKVESTKLRASARDEACTLNLPGICNYNPDTTVLAHLPFDSGMGTKSTDLSSCYACSSCHDFIDGRTSESRDGFPDFDYFLRRAQTRTMARFVEKNLIAIK